MADPKRPPDELDPDSGSTEELVAYLDGELDPKSAEAVATRLSLDPKLRSEADALQRAWDILDVLPRTEPSAAFASRTLSQVIPVPTASGRPLAVGGGSPTVVAPNMPTEAAAGAGLGFWLVSAILIGGAGAGGYFAHRALVPTPNETPPLEDVPLMKNMRLYRNVDDVEYLKKLNSLEMFGDEGD